MKAQSGHVRVLRQAREDINLRVDLLQGAGALAERLRRSLPAAGLAVVLRGPPVHVPHFAPPLQRPTALAGLLGVASLLEFTATAPRVDSPPRQDESGLACSRCLAACHGELRRSCPCAARSYASMAFSSAFACCGDRRLPRSAPRASRARYALDGDIRAESPDVANG